MKSWRVQASFVTAAAILVMAILFYDIMGAIIKHLGAHYSAPQLSMFRNIFGLIPTLIALFMSKNWVDAGRPVMIRQWKLALMRGAIAAVAQVCFYISLSYLELATASTILFTGPLFVTALSIPVLGNRVGFWRWMAVFIGFVGVLWVMAPNSLNFSWYAILPLCAAFLYSCVSVTSRLFDSNVPTGLINLYAITGSLLGSGALLIYSGEFVGIASTQDWLWFFAMGLAGGTAALCLVSAYRMTAPGNLSPFEYFGIPFSFALGWVFFGEAPFGQLIPGVFLIVGGGLVIVWREQHMMRHRDN